VFQDNLLKIESGWRRITYFRQIEIELALYVGDEKRALSSLLLCARSGLIDLLWLDLCPLLIPFQATPEFQATRTIVEERAARILEAYRMS